MSDNPILDKVQKHINQQGWSIISVFGDNKGPAFSYTIGLSETFNHPELILFGVNSETAQDLFTIVVEDILKKGENLKAGTDYNQIADGFAAQFLTIDEDRGKDYLFQLYNYYQDTDHTITTMQLVWQDPNHYFPWEPGYDQKFNDAQPVLGEHVSVTLKLE